MTKSTNSVNLMDITEEKFIETLAFLEIIEEGSSKRDDTSEEVLEYLKIAKACVNKNIPMRPKPRHIKPYDSYNDGWCPICETHIVENEDVKVDHCAKCGQALKWPKTWDDFYERCD